MVQESPLAVRVGDGSGATTLRTDGPFFFFGEVLRSHDMG